LHQLKYILFLWDINRAQNSFALKKILLLSALLALMTGVFAQKEANYWYFGNYAGINFGLGVPIALTDGQLDTGEGCSAISTPAGNLLFYTDGLVAKNKNHQDMLNGTGLFGHYSATQSGLIVPKNGSTTLFYIFTVDAYDVASGHYLDHGLCYSLVDMTLDGGLGGVVSTEKNVQLVHPACEKVTAVGNMVGNGTWVIAHEWNSGAYYSYLITSSGVNQTPVVSNVGAYIGAVSPPNTTPQEWEYSKGYLKVSPDGSKLCAAHNERLLVEIADFNNASGVVSNVIADNGWPFYGTGQGGPYGVEFSPDSKLLYVAIWKDGRQIYQYDMEAGSPAAILASKTLVASVGQSESPIGAMQIGPDNRMYIARMNSGTLSRINFPNTQGIGCSFETNAVNLAGRNCRYGLPPFIQSFFNANVEYFYETPVCFGDTTQFYMTASVNPDSVFWNFGDFASGDDNYSIEWNPRHLFTDTLIHFVSMKYYLDDNIETVVHGVIAHTFPHIDLGNDSTFCYVEPVILDPGPGYATYLWQNGSTNQTMVAATSGTYWCEVTNQFSCPDRDSVILVIGQEPQVDLTADATLIPFGTSTTLHGTYTGGQGPFTLHWEPFALLVDPTSLDPQTVNLSMTTTFSLFVTDESAECTGMESITIYVTGGPLLVNATASPDHICPDETSVLTAMPSGGTGNYTYLWTSIPSGFNSTLQSPTVAPTETTTYHVMLNDELSIIEDDVTVTWNPNPTSYAGEDQFIPFGTTTTLEGQGNGGSGNYSYHWGPAEWLVTTNVQNPTTKNIIETVQFELTVTDNNSGCVGEKDYIIVTPEGGALGAVIQTETPDICRYESSQLTAYASGGYVGHYTYTWTDQYGGTYPSTSSITVSPSVTTIYYVSVFDQFNYFEAQFTQVVYPSAEFILANGQETVTACPYDTVVLQPEPHPDDWNYLWSNGSVSSSIKVGSTGIGFDMKSFTLSVESSNGCVHSEQVTIIFDFGLCFGTGEYAEQAVSIFPNPGKGTISFEGYGDENWSELTIYDINSQTVHHEIFPGTPGTAKQIRRDLSFLPPGIYFISLSGDGARASGKLVILP
jgi:hypothetical protein